jgi:hypothetical protein
MARDGTLVIPRVLSQCMHGKEDEPEQPELIKEIDAEASELRSPSRHALLAGRSKSVAAHEVHRSHVLAFVGRLLQAGVQLMLSAQKLALGVPPQYCGHWHGDGQRDPQRDQHWVFTCNFGHRFNRG